MNHTIMGANIEKVARQRNAFIFLSGVAVISCLLLSLKLVLTKDRVILVPGLNQEVWTTGGGVSTSYLEEVSSMYLPFLLDLDSGSIDWKRERLFTHVSQSDSRYMKELAKYFSKAKQQYAQFSLSTHFAVKHFEVNQKKLMVEAHGQLSSRFGQRGFNSIPAIYRLSFEWVGGKLLLTEFVKLSNEEHSKNLINERDEDKTKSNQDKECDGATELEENEVGNHE